MNKVIARLKDEATKVGANGILIQGTGDEQAAALTAAARGMPSLQPGAVADYPRAASALAASA
jgi:hypothetical protein